MKKSKFSEEQIATALRQVDAGHPVPEVTRTLGIRITGRDDLPEKKLIARERGALRPSPGTVQSTVVAPHTELSYPWRSNETP
jgi:hypothetical protein